MRDGRSFGDEDLFDLNFDGNIDDIELSTMLDEQDRECDALFRDHNGEECDVEEVSEEECFDADADDEFLGADAVVYPKESDFKTRREYNAALKLAYMNESPEMYSDEDSLQCKKVCELILYGKDLPYRYLTEDNGFLVAQAVKEHFDLPCTFPDEDETPNTWLEELVARVARRDVHLSLEVWAWCLKEFGPYLAYSEYEDLIHNDVLFSTLECSPKFLPGLINFCNEHEDFLIALFRDNPCFPYGADEIIYAALEQNMVQTAKKIFAACFENPNTKESEKETLVDNCIDNCKNWDELESMEAFRSYLYPYLKEHCGREFLILFPEWETKMQEYIDDVERGCEKYAFSRRNAWRSKYKDYDGVDVCDYDSEEEYLAAVEQEKHEWRSWRKFDAERYHISVEQFETEDEFEREKLRIIEKERQQNLIKREEEQKQRPEVQRAHTESLLQTDQTAYGFCSVLFQSAVQPYWFLTGSIEVEIGDKVVVPVGQEKREVDGTVVSVGKYLRVAAPYPIDKASTIIRKIEK